MTRLIFFHAAIYSFMDEDLADIINHYLPCDDYDYSFPPKKAWKKEKRGDWERAILHIHRKWPFHLHPTILDLFLQPPTTKRYHNVLSNQHHQLSSASAKPAPPFSIFKFRKLELAVKNPVVWRRGGEEIWQAIQSPSIQQTTPTARMTNQPTSTPVKLQKENAKSIESDKGVSGALCL